ncbi:MULTISPECIES: Na(+)-translocating NADH-quinone reductase subunit A [Vibrio]|uniref:Na(+)-translocating NADH-quinone reductase subunit A n=3 Tax=Vibrio cyclitrophicus TaxID=47951 RepID=A0A7Z1S2X9_9VIBR|nr:MULTISPECIES: Na(+)-translocating NADH-quinone reductase subunit A [Vibrio]KNH12098.1 NADH:ubiquinone oxidoreductase [Vibrio lentus]MBY7661493.1 Na(+)-translocating NADH-quinone reductase subunit A [Vibrio atlanticus]KAA8598567.1 Na(+)-translocating NADH-quinone reductase subunit A [Vibrio cyclitrophicus]MBE8555780.1 Na(+)-translocating NADH-quinone reductase subunit A [Vibrio sp. OPT24]MBE8607263.1 Na(+)-translocating NADH-quinone reductase subunit A [Vibrio sp. OPT10]|tara:strand:+ start:61 stop:1401 length:1341 start_codon:yes stop_codon:yes gene_type:complete
MITINKGLDLPIAGTPSQVINDGKSITKVALLGEEYVGMRPTMHARVGDEVKKGQVLFADKKNPGVVFTSPASGKVIEVNRGAKRVLQSVVIEVAGNEQITFNSYEASQLAGLDRETVKSQLVESGAWTALRTRPFSKVPAIDSETQAIFVTAMDTNPLAAEPELIINEQSDAFVAGLDLLSTLTNGKVYVCKKGTSLPRSAQSNVEEHVFDGPHPAGLAGTHMHYLYPVNAQNVAWSINYQDVIAFGKLFLTGEIYSERVVSLAGPVVNNPRLVRTQIGASLEELTDSELMPGEVRLISGSVLSGVHASGPHAYLGRYHQQVSVLREGRDKELFGWAMPGKNKFSVTRSFLGHVFKGQLFNMTTTTNGSDRSMVPIGNYEKVMPLDMEPTLLLRDLCAGDVDSAQALGALELDEEDLALCTFVCPGKYEYGQLLRECLDIIVKEG